MNFINKKLGTTLTCIYQSLMSKSYKGPYILGIKAFNHLLRYIKLLANDMKSFKTSLKRFSYHHSFYSIEEYYEYKDNERI